MQENFTRTGVVVKDPSTGIPQNLHWLLLAKERARCGTFVLQYLMDKIYAIARDGLLQHTEEERFPLFLVIVGTLIAAKATRDVPYIEVSDTKQLRMTCHSEHTDILLTFACFSHTKK